MSSVNSAIASLNDALVALNDNVWMVIPFLLVAAGAYFGLRTLLVQLRLVPDMMRAVVEKPTDSAGESISAFQAFTISAASRVGTGNIVGVAIAITLGGPGAVFWMWVIAVIGGATAFVESTLAQLWKTRDGDGYRGGPAYYITRGLNQRWLAVAFGIAITMTYGFVYNAVQSNSIADAVSTSLGTSSTTLNAIIGASLAVLTGLIIFGGVQRIARFTQVIVPFMAVAYLLMGLIVLAMNLSAIPGMFALIVSHALGFEQIAGATLGAAFMNGMRRGLFSNEAGQGSAPNAAATAAVSHPVKQGLVQTLGVYFDTLIVCSITAFIILLSNPAYGEGVQTANLTQSALASEVGDWGIHAVTVILFFLAFSSVIGNYYLAQANVEFFTQKPAVMFAFRCLVVLSVFGGALGKITLVWSLADTFAALMVVINLIAVVPLAGIAVRLLKDYSAQRAAGHDPIFLAANHPDIKNVECWDGTDPESQSVPNTASYRRRGSGGRHRR